MEVEDNDAYASGLGDCDDDDNAVFPGNPELCDAKDNNCNGLTDSIANPVANTWIASTGFWHTPSNWSLGMVPYSIRMYYFQAQVAYVLF